MMRTTVKILVVEDNPPDIRLIIELLKESQQRSFEVIPATSLSAAREILKQQKIDVILLDLGLPDSQGLETYQTINKLALDIPIIIITGLQDETIAIRSLAEGAQDYIIKGTFNGELLARSIFYAQERKHHENDINEYVGIVQSSNEAIMSLSPEGIIKRWNNAAQNTYGFSEKDVVGQSFLTLLPQEELKEAESMLNVIRSGDNIKDHEIILLNKNKERIYSQVTASAIKNKMEVVTGIIMLARDCTQQKLSEQQSAIQLRVATLFAESTQVQTLAFSILKTICEILNFEVGELWALNPNEQILQHVVSWSKHGLNDPILERYKTMTFGYGEGLLGYIWEKKTPYLTNDLSNDPICIQKNELASRGLNACYGFPILFDEELFGVLLLFSNRPEIPDVRFMVMFEIIGRQIGGFLKTHRMENELLFLTKHDKLTGLVNRAAAEDALKKAIDDAKRQETIVALIYLGIDKFKDVNAAIGHHGGDVLLKSFAERLQSTISNTDLLARLSGDEFAIVLSGIKSKDEIDLIVKKILTSTEPSFVVDKNEYYVTASIGISLYPYDGVDVTSLFIAADIVMHRVKQAGGNGYQYSSTSFTQVRQKKILMESKLHRALERNEFLIHYQPIVHAETNQIVSVEALIRWKPSDGEMVYPSEFIPLLEQSPLVLSIGEWVLRTACQEMAKWQAAGLRMMSVNISVHQLTSSLVHIVKKILDETGIKPEMLILEITESMLIHNREVVIGIIQAFNKMGVRLAIDDFGTGYSSFAYLKNFQINVLKIDQSFISSIHKSHNADAVIKSMIAMAHTLDMSVIGEGVETKEQLEFLKESGCDEYQGFYFSKPLPPEELLELLRGKS